MSQDGETKIPENRVAIVPLPQDFLIGVLDGRFELRWFPEDAQVVGVHANWETRSVDLMVASQTFEPVPQGMIPPRLGPFGDGESAACVRVEQVAAAEGERRFYLVSQRAERIESADGNVKFREFL